MASKLFILLKSPREFAGVDILKEISHNDRSGVILFEDAAYYSVDKEKSKELLGSVDEAFVLSDDIAARGFEGLTLPGYEVIDYGKAVDLIMERYDQTITL